MPLAPVYADSKNPLLLKTPDTWAKIALSDVFLLLSDHAYLERKAASNALQLLNRWREPGGPPPNWVAVLAGIARDEAAHLYLVTQLLKKRGGHIERNHKSQYASDLRGLVRTGDGPHELLDRLLVSALIEARSYERFEILSREAPDKELRLFYERLAVSEIGHYSVFLDLAKPVVSLSEFKDRWKTLLLEEARIISSQPIGPRLHSGFLSR